MADFTSLKQTIQSYVKQNGNEEITGNILQNVLLAMVSTMGDSAINALASALQDEAAERQNQDGILQGNISTLGGRIDTLQTAINGINTKLAEGYIYAGIATPSTNPGIISGKIFYIALQEGTYTNFGNLSVKQGINILKYNGSAWLLDNLVAIEDGLMIDRNAMIKSGGIFDRITRATGLCLYNEDAVMSANEEFGRYYYTVKLLSSDSVSEGDVVYFSFNNVEGSAAHLYFYDNTGTLIAEYGNNVAYSVITTKDQFTIPSNFGYAIFEQTKNPSEGAAHFDYMFTDKSFRAYVDIIKKLLYHIEDEDISVSANPEIGNYYYSSKLLSSDSVNEGDMVYFRFRSAVGSSAHLYFYNSAGTLIQTFGTNISQSVKITTGQYRIPSNFGFAVFEQTAPATSISHFDYFYVDTSLYALKNEVVMTKILMERASGFYVQGEKVYMELNPSKGQYYYSENVIPYGSASTGQIIKFKFRNAADNSAFIYFCDKDGNILQSFGSNISSSVITTEGVYTIPSGFGYAYFVQAYSTGQITCDYLWKDYSNQELMALIGTISGQIEVCLPTDDLQQYINDHRIVNLTTGVYNVSSTIVIPSNTKIVGVRGGSIVKGNVNLFDISGNADIQIENVTFEGSWEPQITAVTLADLRSKTGFTNTNSGVIATSHAERCNIVNCEFRNLASAGISFDHTMSGSSDVAMNVNIDKCQFFHNFCGIRLGVRAEFHNVSNCEINLNRIGMMVEGGNNTIVACHIDQNGVGFCVSGTDGGNDSHGRIGDCTMNHCVGYGIACVDANNGFTFANCSIFDGTGIMVSNSIGIAYNGGMIGCKLTIDSPRSAGFNMVNDVMFGNPSAYDTGVIEGDTTRLSLKNNRYSVQDDSTGINNMN